METPKHTIRFTVLHSGERAAGIRSYSEEIEIQVKDGMDATTLAEFIEAQRTFLKEWYDGAKVYTEAEMATIIAQQQKEQAAMDKEWEQNPCG